jgi:hypothetical protein
MFSALGHQIAIGQPDRIEYDQDVAAKRVRQDLVKYVSSHPEMTSGVEYAGWLKIMNYFRPSWFEFASWKIIILLLFPSVGYLISGNQGCNKRGGLGGLAPPTSKPGGAFYCKGPPTFNGSPPQFQQ